jgi:hypothetical protein
VLGRGEVFALPGGQVGDGVGGSGGGHASGVDEDEIVNDIIRGRRQGVYVQRRGRRIVVGAGEEVVPGRDGVASGHREGVDDSVAWHRSRHRQRSEGRDGRRERLERRILEKDLLVAADDGGGGQEKGGGDHGGGKLPSKR